MARKLGICFLAAALYGAVLSVPNTWQWALGMNTAPPSLSAGTTVVSGSWATESDGVRIRLKDATLNATNSVRWSTPITDVGRFSFTAYFSGGSSITTSYLFPGFYRVDSSTPGYQVVMSRGTGEARGALWIQRAAGGVTSGFAGTSGATFTAGILYDVSVSFSGVTNLTMATSVRRRSDLNWLQSNGTWAASQAVALTWTDTTPLAHTNGIDFSIRQSAQDGCLYNLSVTPLNAYQNYTGSNFVRNQVAPVLVKGGVYDGWTADALAAPDVVDDGTRYVKSVSLWSISNGKWATAFFTSPHGGGMRTWTYVPGSLLAPQGSDYILGDAGLAWYGGKYWFGYDHYVKNASQTLALAYSTDLLTWTVVSDPFVANGPSPSFAVNPNGQLELWYGTTHMWSSLNGTSWTDNGTFGSSGGCAESAIFYVGTVRYLLEDCLPGYAGARYIAMRHSLFQNTDWITDIDGLQPILYSGAAGWERKQVFDPAVIVTDLGDGHGAIPWLLYAGSDNTSAADATDSSIGIAFWKVR